MLGVAARATLQPQSLATVFIIIFVFPSPRPLPCINNYLYVYTRKGVGRWKHENNDKNSGKRLWLQHTGTISERDGNPNSSTLYRACALVIGTIWERAQYQNATPVHKLRYNCHQRRPLIVVGPNCIGKHMRCVLLDVRCLLLPYTQVNHTSIRK